MYMRPGLGSPWIFFLSFLNMYHFLDGEALAIQFTMKVSKYFVTCQCWHFTIRLLLELSLLQGSQIPGSSSVFNWLSDCWQAQH